MYNSSFLVQESNVSDKVSVMADSDDLLVTCRSQLRPFFEMLKFRKKAGNDEDWLNRVKRTQENIINSPRQYLTTSARHDVLELVVRQVFKEFVDEINQAK